MSIKYQGYTIAGVPLTDTTPTSGSDNVITSGGVYTALSGKQNTLTFDTTPTQNSTNPVTSGGVYTAINTAITNAIGGSY